MPHRPYYRKLRADHSIFMRDPFPDPTVMVELRGATATLLVRAATLNAALAQQRRDYAAQATLGADGLRYGPTGRRRPTNRIAVVDVDHLISLSLAA